MTDYIPFHPDDDVNAVIEIPAGTWDKWELNKSNAQLEWELVVGKLRIANYLVYPSNYEMIPQTLLWKEKGGDGDPLDIMVLRRSSERDDVIKCKILGVFYLMDRKEQDDKLIEVSDDSPFY